MTFPVPVAELAPNTYAFESTPVVKATGFREYDARWWFGHPGSTKAPELNLMGLQALGMGLGTLLHELGKPLEVVTGHDFRSYSGAVKTALMQGLMASGCTVHDIGLALSPMAYFAQFHLDVGAVAMVTASHNDNGWTGVKMGCDRPVTFGPDEMGRLKEIVLSGNLRTAPRGAYNFVSNLAEAYIDDITRGKRIGRKLKVVAACGNGTAGAFVPKALEKLGVEVIPLDCDPDWTFPRYNPNPEDMEMLEAMGEAVRSHGADLGLGFDGDGDRCGVVDETGHEIFADKIGVMLARDLSAVYPDARFVVDVKSTGLYATDPVLMAQGATTDYWKTGHSYIKRRVRDLDALAGFEKSGHFFFGPPLGRGYDDGLLTALAVLEMLDRAPGRSLGDLYKALPLTHGSPTMSPHCADEVKYAVIERVTARLSKMVADGSPLAGQRLVDAVTVNGIRVTSEDGTWGLIRASSNKPELVVVVESPVSAERRDELFRHLDAVLRENTEVGAYNQSL